MKRLVLALAFSACAAASASAQGVYVGPRGVHIDPGYNQRGYDRRGYEERRFRQERRYGGYEGGYGRGCRTITVRREDPYGNERIKRVRRCD